jgi:hypothetical protein
MCACNHYRMSQDDSGRESFEEMVRAIAREVSKSAERMAQVDVDEIADAIGLDPSRARRWVEGAGSWLRGQAESFGDDPVFPGASPAADRPAVQDPLPSAAPHPLDLPTEEQGLALAALDSGRWTVEPGSNALASHGDGPGPTDALGLVRELHARDWIAVDGEVTLVGRHALSRWLDAATPH